MKEFSITLTTIKLIKNYWHYPIIALICFVLVGYLLTGRR